MRIKDIRPVRDDRKGKTGTRVEKPMIRGMWGREDLLLKMEKVKWTQALVQSWRQRGMKKK